MTTPTTYRDATDLIGTMIESVTSGIMSIDFSSQGQMLLGALTVIALAMAGIKHQLASESFADTVASMFGISLLWGFASWIIGFDYGGFNFQDELIAGFDLLVGEILGDPHAFNVILGMMLSSALELFQGDTSVSDTSWWDAIFDSGLHVASFVMKFFSACFIVLVTMLYAGQYLVTQFMIVIGCILAPILVPWVMIEQTRFLFEGWLKFMIVAGMQKVVGALMLKGSMQVITDAKRLADDSGGDALASFYIYAVVLIGMGIMAYLMSQATGTAQSLLSGGIGMGRFIAPSRMTPGGAAAAGTATAKAPFTAGKALAGTAYKAWKGSKGNP